MPLSSVLSRKDLGYLSYVLVLLSLLFFALGALLFGLPPFIRHSVSLLFLSGATACFGALFHVAGRRSDSSHPSLRFLKFFYWWQALAILGLIHYPFLLDKGDSSVRAAEIALR